METPSRQGLSPRAPSSARAPSSGGDALFRQRLTPDIDEVIRQRKSELQKLKTDLAYLKSIEHDRAAALNIAAGTVSKPFTTRTVNLS